MEQSQIPLMVEFDTRPLGFAVGSAEAAGRAPVAPPPVPPNSDEPPLLDLGAALRESPPWLVSAIIHMLLMIFLGLAFLQNSVSPGLNLDLGYSEDLGDPLADDLSISQDEPTADEEQVLTAENLPIVVDPLATPDVTHITPSALMPTGPVMPTSIGLALTGREPGMKQALLKAYGGTGRTEGAVGLGLRWLAAQQHRNGTWSLQGPYSDGGSQENIESATAMALLAFQGAGHTPVSDPAHPFTPVVRRGWNALLKRMKDDGRFNEDVPRTHQMYTQAQCTIALCELYAMTGDAQYYDPAQKAVDYCVRVQSPQGGWRYNPDPVNGESDMSVTGWVVMALQSARMAGIEVPSPVFDRVSQFLDSVGRDDGSRYAYQTQAGATLTLTAEGLLCRQYLGWAHDDPRLNAGVEYLLKNLPDWNKLNVYYWYYATQVLHHLEGDPWREWNNVMRKVLPANQETRGRERGSWDPTGDRFRGEGGRLYVTCLSIYTLEIYYRHLPLYQTGLYENRR
ncbi:MAG: prenyltransferase/squalene oxidase repeat-containing protein [Pirellulales bacterium]